jgi:hypothetical protein
VTPAATEALSAAPTHVPGSDKHRIYVGKDVYTSELCACAACARLLLYQLCELLLLHHAQPCITVCNVSTTCLRIILYERSLIVSVSVCAALNSVVLVEQSSRGSRSTRSRLLLLLLL